MTQTTDTRELDDLAAALDAATSQIAALEPLPRQVVTDSINSLNALNALHKSGLTTIVRRLKDDPHGKELLFELVDDPGVRMILGMHGIIRPDVTTQVRQVLDGVRAGLQTHGGDVDLDTVRDGVVYVRLEGACNGTVALSVQMIARREIFLCDTWSGPNSTRFATNAPRGLDLRPFWRSSGGDLAVPLSRDGSMQQCRTRWSGQNASPIYPKSSHLPSPGPRSAPHDLVVVAARASARCRSMAR